MPDLAVLAPAVPARVLIVDDHALLRTGVANIINHEPDIEVVGKARNGAEAVSVTRDLAPDAKRRLSHPVIRQIVPASQIRREDDRVGFCCFRFHVYAKIIAGLCGACWPFTIKITLYVPTGTSPAAGITNCLVSCPGGGEGGIRVNTSNIR